jgi:hypothetical protein
MKVIYSNQPMEIVQRPALFLAGPTPRLKHPVPSWRPEALTLLKDFPGTVCVPEYTDFKPLRLYQEQVEWEWAALHACDVIVFWVPRELVTMPAFTTNVEFGFYIGKKQTVYGRPPEAPKTEYLDWLYGKVTGKKPHSTLADTLSAAVELCRV